MLLYPPPLIKKGVSAGSSDLRTIKAKLKKYRVLCANAITLAYSYSICYSLHLSWPTQRLPVNLEQSDSIFDEPEQPTVVKKKAGRPKGVFGLKRQIQEYARNPALALPKTDNQRIKDLRDMLIRSSGKDVVEKMISIALNDEHPAQMAAIKMCVDRTLPISMFEKDKSQRSAIHINITGIGATVDTPPVDVEDIEAKHG